MKKQSRVPVLLSSFYLTSSVVLFALCSWWSDLQPGTSIYLALIPGLPMAPLFVMETRDMASIIPAYMLNAALIYAVLASRRRSQSESTTE